jgi:hypothetical protein
LKTLSRRRRLARGLSPFLALVLILLAGCSFNARIGQLPTPTLVSTLAIVIPPTATQQPTFTPAPETPTATITETPTPSATLTPTQTPAPTDTITPGPSPTASRTSTQTRVPTSTRLPTRTLRPSRTPTITLTPMPPDPALYFVRPGLLSKVVSPIQMEVYGITGGDARMTFELLGEDGRVISRQVLDYGGVPRRRFWISPELPFEVDAAAETARLQLVIYDEFGRLEGLSSVDLVLMQMGRNEINPPAITEESYLIRSPDEEDTITGGTLVIEALARPINDSPLIIELIDESGRVLVVKQVVVPPPTGPLSHTPFTVTIPYKVSEPVPVRLSIRQEGSRIPGTIAQVSELITLLP